MSRAVLALASTSICVLALLAPTVVLALPDAKEVCSPGPGGGEIQISQSASGCSCRSKTTGTPVDVACPNAGNGGTPDGGTPSGTGHNRMHPCRTLASGKQVGNCAPKNPPRPVVNDPALMQK